MVRPNKIKRKPTPKQQRFITAYIENGGNATQAAMTAYPNATYATARMIGSENLTKPTIRGEIERALGEVELTAKDAVRTIKRSLDATTESGHPDWGSQLKAADMTLKLTNAYPRDEIHPTTTHNTQINVVTEPAAVLRAMLGLRRRLEVGEREVLLGPRGDLVAQWVEAAGRWPTREEIARLISTDSIGPQ